VLLYEPDRDRRTPLVAGGALGYTVGRAVAVIVGSSAGTAGPAIASVAPYVGLLLFGALAWA